MLIVVAHRMDQTAEMVVGAWNRPDTVIMRPSDLAAGDFSYRPGQVLDSVFRAGSRLVAAHDVTGVLVRVPWVLDDDLLTIRPGEREYVAAEMSAVLLSWLTELPARVINQPTPSCLCGPAWSQERWLGEADALGLPVAATCRDVGPLGFHSSPSARARPTAGEQLRFTVVGGTALAAPTREWARWGCRLARRACCDLLACDLVRCDGQLILTAVDVWPDVTTPVVAAALLAAFDTATPQSQQDSP